MISIVLLVCLACTSANSQPPFPSSFAKLNLPKPSVGPESITFDFHGRGPYTGISDGRIVRYHNPTATFKDFAFTVPNRSKEICDGSNSPNLHVTCGRTLGLEFYYLKNLLYIADASRGLFVVGRRGGLATPVATGVNGKPFKFLNGVTVDQKYGHVYFTEFSTVFSLSEVLISLPTNDSSGRLLKYNPTTRHVTVLKTGLSGANGVAISLDRSYLLVSEFLSNRIQRFWLRGPKAYTSEVVATFTGGNPDNIKRISSVDNFWLTLNIPSPSQTSAIKIDGNGVVLKTVNLSQYYNNMITVSEFLEYRTRFYAGSVNANFVGAFT